MDFRRIASGSIVRITVPGTRSSDGEPRQIPAIVIGQDQEDGMLSLFAFHFEGQWHAQVPVQIQKYRIEVVGGKEIRVPYYEDNVEVVYDAAAVLWKDNPLCTIVEELQSYARRHESDLAELRQTVADDIQTLQRTMAEFQETVMSMITSPDVAAESVPAGDVESTRAKRK